MTFQTNLLHQSLRQINTQTACNLREYGKEFFLSHQSTPCLEEASSTFSSTFSLYLPNYTVSPHKIHNLNIHRRTIWT